MTKRILGAISAAAVVLSLLAAPAAAEPFTPELEADYTAALAWWGVSSPPQCATVTRELLPADLGESDGIEAMGRATEPGPGESGLACVLDIYANRLVPGCPSKITVRHEVGHLLGYGHSEDPASVMNPLAVANLCGPIMVEEEVAAARRREWQTLRTRRAQCPGRSHPSACFARMRSWAQEIRVAG